MSKVVKQKVYKDIVVYINQFEEAVIQQLDPSFPIICDNEQIPSLITALASFCTPEQVQEIEFVKVEILKSKIALLRPFLFDSEDTNARFRMKVRQHIIDLEKELNQLTNKK